jgi:putative copper resistance protein D
MDNFFFVPSALAAALFDLAFACTTGLVLVSTFSVEQGPRTRHVDGCVIAMIVALAVQACLAVAVMTGSYQLRILLSEFVDVTTGTHAGRMVVWSFACAVLALVCSNVFGQTKMRDGAMLVVLALLAASRATSGHAAVDGGFSLAEVSQFLHLASIAVWSGGVIASGLVVVPTLWRANKPEQVVAFTTRLSRVVTVALLVVAVTGAYNAYRGLGRSLVPLAHTQWGVLLTAKLALVFVAISIGAYSRRMARAPVSLARTQAPHLVQALRWEAVVMLLILTISAFLANSATPL